MWKCPKCGRSFEKAEQSHFCNLDLLFTSRIWAKVPSQELSDALIQPLRREED